MHEWPISIPDRKQALVNRGVSPELTAAFAREIFAFLQYLAAAPQRPVTLPRQFFVWSESRGKGPTRAALRWFCREGPRRPTGAGAIRTVQERLGHASGETTLISTRVMPKPGFGVRSPFDALRAGSFDSLGSPGPAVGKPGPQDHSTPEIL